MKEIGWNDDETLTIITTDHGGVPGTGSHGGRVKEEVSVFFGVRGGEDVRKGEAEEDITNMDAAAVALWGLGVPVPDWFDAKLPWNLQ